MCQRLGGTDRSGETTGCTTSSTSGTGWASPPRWATGCWEPIPIRARSPSRRRRGRSGSPSTRDGRVAELQFQERAADGKPAGLLVLHHGRGTDERDLLGLADLLDSERRLHVAAPRGPLQLPGSPGYHWYLVPRVGHPDPRTFEESRRKLAQL